jgi:RNA polymerase sigma factor (TIGR02999 family)
LAGQSSFTEILSRATDGDAGASAALLPLVYDELRRVASTYLSRQPPGHTLQPTALVHEAYMRLVGSDRAWKGRAHFLAAAAMSMRRLLVDHARARKTAKRGGGVRVQLNGATAAPTRQEIQILELNDLLDKLGRLDERKSRVAEMKLFGGLTLDQIAESLGISRSVAGDDWTVARAWLAAEIRDA